MKKIYLLLSLALLSLPTTFAQKVQKINGPVIQDYGQTYPVDNIDWVNGHDSELKVIFDVAESSEDKSQHNQNLEFAARFLNMHVNAGMSPEQLKAAMTIHAKASHDVLIDAAYKAIYGVNNPNTTLIDQLTAAGVDLVLCGQAAAKRDIDRKDLNPNIKVALSATTAIIQYQNEGYRFVKY